MKVKVCGMRDQENIAEIAALGPDYMGFIFHPPSPRYVYALEKETVPLIPIGPKRVGVFVNESVEGIIVEHARWKFDLVQLHGEESVEFCEKLRLKLPEVEIMKAFQVNNEFDMGQVIPYESSCAFALLDTASAAFGGSGEVFDWEKMSEYSSTLPVMIAGGLNPQTVGSLLEVLVQKPDVAERVIGIDLNSGAEDAPAQKNPILVEEVISIVREGR